MPCNLLINLLSKLKQILDHDDTLVTVGKDSMSCATHLMYMAALNCTGIVKAMCEECPNINQKSERRFSDDLSGGAEVFNNES